jgi:ADP-ribosylglycohydrolase
MIGCLLGGAIGDAMGYPVEFMRYSDITRYFGGAGVRGLSESNLISDDTQMTLFTAEGLLNAYRSGKSPVKSVYRSYLRWYYTQCGVKMPGAKYEGGLLNEAQIFASRAPGSTCLASLSSGRMGTLADPINNSRGCGGVMRVAPCAVFPHAFDLGCRVAAITHGHPGGYISAGAFSELLQKMYYGQSLPDAMKDLIDELYEIEGAESTYRALEKAVDLAEEGRPCAPTVKELGQGWVGEEALSIAVYSALSFPTDFAQAVRLSVNHDGDSDSTGAICGNIMGMLLGAGAIPVEWRDGVEMCNVIRAYAVRLSTIPQES